MLSGFEIANDKTFTIQNWLFYIKYFKEFLQTSFNRNSNMPFLRNKFQKIFEDLFKIKINNDIINSYESYLNMNQRNRNYSERLDVDVQNIFQLLGCKMSTRKLFKLQLAKNESLPTA